jgi:hypothetical protein
MKSFLIFFLVIGVPLLLFLWHSWKTADSRPNAYNDIHARPVIPAVIIDVDMPFPSMVVFLFKLALAALPALVMLTLVLGFLLGGLFAGLGGFAGRF